MTARVCSDCPATISVQSKGGRCRACANRAARNDPAREARRLAALRLAHQRPEYRAKKSAENKARHQARKDDPAWQEYLREQGRRVQAAYRASPEAQERRKAASVGVGQKLRAQRLAWCPAELRDEYAVLRRRWGAERARAAIEAKIPGTAAYERQQLIERAPLYAEAAADFLRKLSPVLRCDPDGRLNPRGRYWRRGSATMDSVAIVKRAADRGWQPDSWRRVG